ncbi:MAG TPA: O-antigen ligase family protein [Opitutaceae bacterium]|nr:O-antigen ligase family protein [Opitutaceae bacterium]
MKFPGANPRHTTELGDWVVLGHVGGMIVITSWSFGGQTPWMRELATFWSLAGGIGIAVRAMTARPRDPARTPRRYLALLWPLFAFAALAIVSALNPLYAPMQLGGQEVLVEQRSIAWLPASASPGDTLRDLALFVGIVLSCFNLYWAVNDRRTLRRLCLLIAVNTVALAVLGTVQKLLGATLMIGGVLPPNLKFFSTFIYHNHWGAFTLVTLCMCVALLFQSARHRHGRFWSSPGVSGLVATLFLAASLPISESRSSTALAVLVAGAACTQVAWLAIKRRTALKSLAIPAAISLTLLGIALAAITMLARPMFEARIAQTRQQMVDIREGNWDAVDDRPAVYRDTLRMIADRPLTGWGLESYGHVFPLYKGSDVVGPRYVHAHSDWLQTVAECGILGTLLLVVFAARFLWRLPIGGGGPFAAWLFAGCVVVIVYAALEFPFANPAVQMVFWTAFFGAVRYVRLVERQTSREQSTALVA